jgi:hypothetical protein
VNSRPSSISWLRRMLNQDWFVGSFFVKSSMLKFVIKGGWRLLWLIICLGRTIDNMIKSP